MPGDRRRPSCRVPALPRRLLLAAVVAAVAAGCGGSGPSADDAVLAPAPGTFGPSPSVSPAAAPASPAAGTVTLTVGTVTAGTATAGSGSAGPGHTVVASTATTSPVSSTIRPSRGTVVVTQDDYDRTVELATGDRLVVRLTGSYWTDPSAADGSVLRRDAVRRSADGLEATFTAVAPGRSDVTAQTDPPCAHATPPCLMAQRGLLVHAVVHAGSA